MAALMKYVQLEPELRMMLQQARGSGGSDRDTSTDANKKLSSSSSSSTETHTGESVPSDDSNTTTFNKKLLARLEAYRDTYIALTPPDNFDTALYKSVEILSGTCHPNGKSGTATFRVKFSARYCNKFGTVHGGAIATLLDGLAQCSTAVVDGEKNEVTMGNGNGKVRGGATRGLQIGFLKSVNVGEAVIVLCEILKSSGTYTTIRETARREIDGEVLAVCSMEKERPVKAKL